MKLVPHHGPLRGQERTGTRDEDELDKDLQANLSEFRLELLSKWAEITRKCALNGRDAVRCHEVIAVAEKIENTATCYCYWFGSPLV